MKKYRIIPTKKYRKDYERLRKSGVDLGKLESVIDRLAAGELLPMKYQDHSLHGNMRHIRECHIGPDWLLCYTKNEGNLVLLLLATGDHRHVLGIE